MKKLIQKLFKVKKELQAVKKNADNPFFSSKYAELNTYLDEVEPRLHKEGLMLLQPCEVRQDGKQVLKTIIIDTESGEQIESVMEIVSEKKDPQKIGSSTSYFRRYSLASLLAMRAEDDDGSRGSGKSFKKKKQIESDDEF